MPSVDPARALVTGASSGIGEAYARRLAAEGLDVVLVARRADRLDALAGSLRAAHGVDVEVLVADLATDVGVATVVDRLSGDVSPVGLLVNNAGFGTTGRLAQLDPVREQEEIALNVGALVRLTQAVLPAMSARGSGAIVNVASIAGLTPVPGNATYSSTKAFVVAFTRSLAEEVRGTGVRVQVLCPGMTRTEFQATADVDTTTLPGFVWQEADEVVDASWRALHRRHPPVTVVPGGFNKAVVFGARLVPVSIRGRIATLFGR